MLTHIFWVPHVSLILPGSATYIPDTGTGMYILYHRTVPVPCTMVLVPGRYPGRTVSRVTAGTPFYTEGWHSNTKNGLPLRSAPRYHCPGLLAGTLPGGRTVVQLYM